MRPHATIGMPFLLLVLLGSVSLAAQNYPAIALNTQPRPSVEILSDRRGVSFGPYLQDAVEDVRLRWLPVVPRVARAPRLKQGTVIIRFAITRDGDIRNLKVEKSSGNRKMDRAAFKSVRASSPFPPLPRKFDGPFLAVRLRFYYNPAPALRPASAN